MGLSYCLRLRYCLRHCLTQLHLRHCQRLRLRQPAHARVPTLRPCCEFGWGRGGLGLGCGRVAGLWATQHFPYNITCNITYSILWHITYKITLVATSPYLQQVSARALEVGIWGAYQNVLINLNDITDRDYAATIEAEGSAMNEGRPLLAVVSSQMIRSQ